MLLTLRMARENNHMTQEEVSKKTGIPLRTIRRTEKDNRYMKLDRFMILLRLYKVSLNHIYIGKEEDYYAIAQAELLKWLRQRHKRNVKIVSKGEV